MARASTLRGRYRWAAAEQAGAEANTARFDLANARRTIEATADADLSYARTRLELWREMNDAVAIAADAAARTEEAMFWVRSIFPTCCRRMMRGARSDAVPALAKLQIDSHSSWM